MDKRQAEEVVQAILEPDLKAQEELHRKREVEVRSLGAKRFVAWFVLSGFAMGAALAYFSGERFTSGGLWGAIGGAAVGWAIVAWRKHRHAA